MKRNRAVCYAGILVLLFCTVSLHASTISISDFSVGKGVTEFMVTIVLDNPDQSYAGFELNLKYDRALLAIDRIKPVGRLAGQSDIGYGEYDFGNVAIVVYDSQGDPIPADSGAVFEVYFDVVPHAPDGVTEISISQLTALTEELESDTLMVQNGIVDIADDNTAIGEDDNEEDVPVITYCLKQNYPNPFNPSTTIEYAIENETDVLIEIYDVLGQRIRTLVNEKQPAGRYKAVWDGRNNRGDLVASGVYFYRIKAGKFRNTKKMVILR